MPTGTVKSYNASKGHGFVSHAGKDVFIMHSELAGLTLKEGNKITFTVSETDKGPQATNIKVNIPESEKRYKGTVKSFVYGKGYGFIECEGFPGEAIFFMKSALSEQAREAVQKGSWCIFKKVDTEKGSQAEDVFLIGAVSRSSFKIQLQDPKQFPALSKEMTVVPRGRKARRSGVRKPEAAPKMRARAYSLDAGLAASLLPRSGLKKPRESLDSVTCGAEKSMLATLQQEMQENMRQQAHLLGGVQHVGMQLNQMLAKLPTDLEAETFALPVVQDAKPRPSFGADDTSEADAESVSPTRRRRLSNPRSAPLELPSGGSWEYPLTKEEKKARVVMIGEAEIDSLQDENDDLQELVSRLSVDQKQ